MRALKWSRTSLTTLKNTMPAKSRQTTEVHGGRAGPQASGRGNADRDVREATGGLRDQEEDQSRPQAQERLSVWKRQSQDQDDQIDTGSIPCVTCTAIRSSIRSATSCSSRKSSAEEAAAQRPRERGKLITRFMSTALLILAAAESAGLISLLVWLLILALVIYVRLSDHRDVARSRPRSSRSICLVLALVFLIVLLQRLGFHLTLCRT